MQADPRPCHDPDVRADLGGWISGPSLDVPAGELAGAAEDDGGDPEPPQHPAPAQ
jgi:hypothetical protein